jgi:uncharacterized membrane protein YhaH (DUF805 family)
MQPTSPYAPPQGELVDELDTFGTIKVLSASGRIGRLRYISYSFGIAILAMLVMRLILVAVATSIPADVVKPIVLGIVGLTYLGVIIVNVLLTIQRCHDFNVTGWLSLILLIPFTPLLFWVIPGTNEFAPSCPFLKRGGSPHQWICSIHDVKPDICRNYPVSRKHALMTGCPGFDIHAPGQPAPSGNPPNK